MEADSTSDAARDADLLKAIAETANISLNESSDAEAERAKQFDARWWPHLTLVTDGGGTTELQVAQFLNRVLDRDCNWHPIVFDAEMELPDDLRIVDERIVLVECRNAPPRIRTFPSRIYASKLLDALEVQGRPSAYGNRLLLTLNTTSTIWNTTEATPRTPHFKRLSTAQRIVLHCVLSLDGTLEMRSAKELSEASSHENARAINTLRTLVTPPPPRAPPPSSEASSPPEASPKFERRQKTTTRGVSPILD